jgi:hypothetical protein
MILLFIYLADSVLMVAITYTHIMNIDRVVLSLFVIYFITIIIILFFFLFFFILLLILLTLVAYSSKEPQPTSVNSQIDCKQKKRRTKSDFNLCLVATHVSDALLTEPQLCSRNKTFFLYGTHTYTKLTHYIYNVNYFFQFLLNNQLTNPD